MFPLLEWSKPSAEKVIYLTFDDGPHPEITPWVIRQLGIYNAKATFFCVGENSAKHQSVMEELRNAGHSIGNHTYNHIKGWKTADLEYIRNTSKSEEFTSNRLFRPPYGRITRSQSQLLRMRGYEIIMWTQLSCDYINNLNCEKALKSLVSNAKPGNIVVFHDSEKASENLFKLLPEYLRSMTELGYQFKNI